MKKPTCGVLYKEMFDLYSQGKFELQRAFAAGFVTGQAEKVYLGVCPAAMFRPSEEHHPWFRPMIEDVANRYGLSIFELIIEEYNRHEFWIYKREELRGLLELVKSCEFNGPLYHRRRGILCGVPDREIDMNFHEREGYNERCD